MHFAGTDNTRALVCTGGDISNFEKINAVTIPKDGGDKFPEGSARVDRRRETRGSPR